MRKKTLVNIAEHIMWGLIVILPLIVWVISQNNGTNTFVGVMSEFGISTDNVVYSSMSDLFGSSGVLHFFNVDSTLLLYFTYFIIVEILHVIIDILLFIPRLSHKWINQFTGGVDYD